MDSETNVVGDVRLSRMSCRKLDDMVKLRGVLREHLATGSSARVLTRMRCASVCVEERGGDGRRLAAVGLRWQWKVL